jgi:hypothetical protein
MSAKRTQTRKRVDLRNQTKVDLPKDYPWKVLESLAHDLSDCFNKEELSGLLEVTRKRDYEQYQHLSSAWSPQSLNSSEISPHEFGAKYQVGSLLKKYRFPSDNKCRTEAALKKFRDAEVTCKDFNLNRWKDLDSLPWGTLSTALTNATGFLSKLLGEELPSRTSLTEWSRHGPGANLDTKKSAVSSYDKYKNWPYSCTKDALGHARLAIESDERWLGALEDDYRSRYGIKPWELLDRQVFWENVLHVVPGNRITFVPKNAQTDRSIAIEPAMNLYLQLGVDGYIRRKLKRWGVDLDSQEKNKELARQGSLHWQTEDPFVTLDLAAASDTISIDVCRLMLPPAWFSYLMELRSPFGECDGEIFEFEKISSMGNGFTFALESALFFAITYGVSCATQGSYDRDEIAVFGDDIICRQSISSQVVTLLNLCGFSINHDKSFFKGPFRESCGADWFKGHPVRPVFLDELPSTVMGLYCDFNRLRRILSLRSWGSEQYTLERIIRWIPEKFRRIQGPVSDELFDAYLHSSKPRGGLRNGVYTFKRILVKSKSLSGNSFFFRKLMHPLRPGHEIPPLWFKLRWGGAQVQGAGGRFTITSRQSVKVGLTNSQTSYWSDEYGETLPTWPPLPKYQGWWIKGT